MAGILFGSLLKACAAAVSCCLCSTCCKQNVKRSEDEEFLIKKEPPSEQSTRNYQKLDNFSIAEDTNKSLSISINSSNIKEASEGIVNEVVTGAEWRYPRPIPTNPHQTSALYNTTAMRNSLPKHSASSFYNAANAIPSEQEEVRRDTGRSKEIQSSGSGSISSSQRLRNLPPVEATESKSGNIITANLPLFKQLQRMGGYYDLRPPTME